MIIAIPSKDRACQLQLLLSSLEQNWTLDGLQLRILHTSTNEDFAEGYRKLKWDYRRQSNIVFIEQFDFCRQIKYLINSSTKNVGFFVDDCVFFRRPEIHPVEVEDVLENEQIITFSLRLGENTRLQNYLTGELQPALQPQELYRDIIAWRWNRHPTGSNYNYIFSWDGHFYSKEWLYKLLDNKNFENPRALEHQVSIDTNLRDNTRPYMTSCRQSSVVVNTINCVQEGGPLAGVFHSYNIRELNQRYLDGEIISLSSFNDCEINSCHTEIPLKFERA